MLMHHSVFTYKIVFWKSFLSFDLQNIDQITFYLTQMITLVNNKDVFKNKLDISQS